LFFRPEDLNDEIIEGIQDINSNCHIFVGVNPRPPSEGKKESDIRDVICLWADLDGKDFRNGKEEAKSKVEGFPFRPNILVDSGHGYHSYWIFREPILGITDEKRLELKQILSGIAKNLQADRHGVALSGLARLPGTKNIKDSEPLDCKIIHLETSKLYRLEDFIDYKDTGYREVSPSEVFPIFGSKELIISLLDEPSAKTDVARLEVPQKTRKRILTGALLTGEHDRTRSGRDFSIICSLIHHDYNYPTIRSIFFNPFLKCSNRIRERGEAVLQLDVCNAHAKVNENRATRTPQQAKVAEVCRKLGVSEQTYYRWRKEYGGMRVDQAKRLKELEQENARLKKLVADLSLDNAVLKEVNRGNF